MFYLLHGNDEFTGHEQLKKLRQAGNFEYNQERYSGGEVDLATLTATCDTFPFLTDQRLVILDGLPKKKRGEESIAPSTTEPGGKGKKGKKGGKSANSRAAFEQGLAQYLPDLPDFTTLILILDEELEASNPLLKAAQAYGKVINSTLPKGGALENWITRRAKNIGVNITPEATHLLADFIGNQLRLLANELDKLATYVGPDGTIRPQEIELLTASVQEARIFDLTDALAQRNRVKALNLLHELLKDGEPPLKLISTITSQVRSLLLVKELSQKGMRAPQIASTAKIAPFVVDKALRQVGKFGPGQLESAYHQLLATDAALKRSRLTPEMALDLLITTFGQEANLI